jgi:hypothetical protein
MSQQHVDSVTGTSPSGDGSSQLSKYLCKVEDHSLTTSDISSTLNFWIQRETVYDKLALVAEDILSAPAWKGCFLFVACLLLAVEIE